MGDGGRKGGRGGFVRRLTVHQWDAVGGTEKDGFHVWVPDEELVESLLDAGVLCIGRERTEGGRDVSG